jgi:hypothetical protein
MIFFTVVIVMLAVAFLCLQYVVFHRQARLEQNDIVFLKRKYRSRYPEISPGLPLRIINNNGHEVKVTFVKPSDSYICNEIVYVNEVRKGA